MEFTDQGAFFEKNQAYCALKNIGKEKDKTSIILLVYAHGWKHNAQKDDPDLIEFRKLQQSIAEKELDFAKSRNIRPRIVLEVFLGWRGQSLSPMD